MSIFGKNTPAAPFSAEAIRMLTQQEFDDESPVPELKSAKATGVENATATYRQALQQPLDKPPVTRE